nr:interferon-inducible GTPase 5-like [Pogona vitticeps]
MAGKAKESRITLTEAQIKDLKKTFEKGSYSELSGRLEETLASLENICLDVGVTGEPGVGKSTFINAFRDLHEDDEGAAPTGNVASNKNPVPYSHPKYAHVILWDLPSIGTPNFHAKDYLEDIQVSHYDFFVILASSQFTSLHASLAHYLKKSDKDVYFVRSKVDEDLEAIRQNQPAGFNEAAALEKLREECVQDLKAAGVKSPKIFLISNFLLSRYDFPLLGETLWKDLDLQRSHSFLLATPNISHRLLEKKKAAMIEHLWLVSAVACGLQAESIHEISVICNVDLLVKMLQGYCISFGLEESSLRKVAEHAAQPVEHLRSLVKSPLANEIAKEQVVELLIQAASKPPKLPKELVTMASMGLSFAVVYNMLKTFVDNMAGDAHRILVKVFMSQKPRGESEIEIPNVSETERPSL